MNRSSFIKGLFGIGVTSLIKTQANANPKNSFNDSLKTIDNISKKICNAFMNKNSNIIFEKDYQSLSEAYDIFLEEFLKENGEGSGSDFHFKKGVFSKIRYNLLKGDIKSADVVFMKYFGDIHNVARIHFSNKIDINASLAIAHKHYAEHLLYYNYIDKAKTKINWFKQNCNEYSLSKLTNKKIWYDLENESYKGNLIFLDKFNCI